MKVCRMSAIRTRSGGKISSFSYTETKDCFFAGPIINSRYSCVRCGHETWTRQTLGHRRGTQQDQLSVSCPRTVLPAALRELPAGYEGRQIEGRGEKNRHPTIDTQIDATICACRDLGLGLNESYRFSASGEKKI